MRLFGELLGLSGGIVFALGLLTYVVLFAWLPLMAFFALRHVRGIRRELERLNDTLSSSRGGLTVSPNPTDPAADARIVERSQGVVRTSPLGMNLVR